LGSAGAYVTQPHQAGAPYNACTSSHRAQCDMNSTVPPGKLVMPEPFSDSTLSAAESTARDEVRNWCESLTPRGEGEKEEEEAARKRRGLHSATRKPDAEFEPSIDVH